MFVVTKEIWRFDMEPSTYAFMFDENKRLQVCLPLHELNAEHERVSSSHLSGSTSSTWWADLNHFTSSSEKFPHPQPPNKSHEVVVSGPAGLPATPVVFSMLLRNVCQICFYKQGFWYEQSLGSFDPPRLPLNDSKKRNRMYWSRWSHVINGLRCRIFPTEWLTSR